MNPFWLIIFGIAIVWSAWTILKYGRNNKLYKHFLVGFILMWYDWIIENIGYILGYWESKDAGIYLLAVPMVVMLICFFGGTAWSIVSQKITTTRERASFTTSFGVGGSWMEMNLLYFGCMSYGNGWYIIHAFVGYLLTWILFKYVSDWIVK